MKHTSGFIILFLCSIVLPACNGKQAETVVLHRAHAHNDYYHARPLLDALSYGYISVEADIHLRNDTLFVAHDSVEIRPERTLATLYLDPLKKRIQANKGSVYGDGSRLILLIDIKTDSIQTYLRLHEVLEKYAGILTVYEKGQEKPGAVLSVISGNRPYGFMERQAFRYAAVDGRLDEPSSEAGAHLFSLVSNHWEDYFSWKGESAMPANERARLDSIVTLLHDRNQMLRFWATPDSQSVERQNVWSALRDAGVDLIGTDDLAGLAGFLKNHN